MTTDAEFTRLRNEHFVDRRILLVQLQEKLEVIKDRIKAETVLREKTRWSFCELDVPNYKTRKKEKIKIFHRIRLELLNKLLEDFNKLVWRQAQTHQWHPKKYRDELVTFLNRQFPYKTAFGSQVEHGLYVRQHEQD